MRFFSEPPLILSMLLLWLFVALLLAPLEALGWWAGWFEGDETVDPEAEPEHKPQPGDHIRAYLVYLTGISSVSGDTLLPEEATFLEHLDQALPDIVVVKDIYPYAVSNRALTGQRVFAWFWRFALRMKLSGRPLQRYIGFLINIRNAFQVPVSADRRYGPIYNSGFARLIVRSLLRHGYQRGSGMPVYVLGFSGGGQIAVGVVPYLKTMIEAPITVISLGGVLGGDPGVEEAEHLYHLYGSRDSVQRMGWILSPSRWHVGKVELLPFSRWNQARQAGKMTFILMGAIKHNGKGGYLDDTPASDTGQSHFQQTLTTVTQLIQHESVYATVVND